MIFFHILFPLYLGMWNLCACLFVFVCLFVWILVVISNVNMEDWLVTQFASCQFLPQCLLCSLESLTLHLLDCPNHSKLLHQQLRSHLATEFACCLSVPLSMHTTLLSGLRGGRLSPWPGSKAAHQTPPGCSLYATYLSLCPHPQAILMMHYKGHLNHTTHWTTSPHTT